MLRTFWMRELEQSFAARSVVWLAGVRRSGKTTLVRALDGAHYHDCELVRVRRALDDPELFFRSLGDRAGRGTVVLDEIHRLPNPSEVLKVGADHFPKLRVVATGSSTLAARHKFKDSLTGRKRDLWLVPMLAQDLLDFTPPASAASVSTTTNARPAPNAGHAANAANAGQVGHASLADLDRRLLRGGLPPFFLAPRLDDKDYEEWVGSYWAKDLSELFVIDKKASFMKFVELVFAQSGGLFEAQSFRAPCDVSRPTVQHWLSILETTLLVTVLRPYHGASASEVRLQPKVYAFDTGFVAYFRGWDALRDDDRGHLLEHLVLGELAARFGTARLHHWRDKRRHEVDFILEVGRRRELLALECKHSPASFDPAGLAAFRRRYPRGDNLVVTLRSTGSYRKSFGELEVEFVPFAELPARLEALRRLVATSALP